jgi:hypothetical protein
MKLFRGSKCLGFVDGHHLVSLHYRTNQRTDAKHGFVHQDGKDALRATSPLMLFRLKIFDT